MGRFAALQALLPPQLPDVKLSQDMEVKTSYSSEGLEKGIPWDTKLEVCLTFSTALSHKLTRSMCGSDRKCRVTSYYRRSSAT